MLTDYRVLREYGDGPPHPCVKNEGEIWLRLCREIGSVFAT